MAAFLLLALLAFAQVLAAAATGVDSAVARDPAHAGHSHRSLDVEASGSKWPRATSLMNAAAKALHLIMPMEGSWSSDTAAAPEVELPEGNGWEARFARGLHRSKMLTEAGDNAVGHWVVDQKGSGAGVPARMLEAEDLMLAAGDAPAEKQRREKTAERALRVYHHAKWLAEHNFARAAEWRYRHAYGLARQSRRSVLAAHCLSRLGYFLLHWRRRDEALEVLRESEQLSKRSNPLAPYLLGVLERQLAGPDTERLRSAEERILGSEEQPSEELEIERHQLMKEINYWRAAVDSPRRCFEIFDAAQVIVCLLGHAFFTAQ